MLLLMDCLMRLCFIMIISYNNKFDIDGDHCKFSTLSYVNIYSTNSSLTLILINILFTPHS